EDVARRSRSTEATAAPTPILLVELMVGREVLREQPVHVRAECDARAAACSGVVQLTHIAPVEEAVAVFDDRWNPSGERPPAGLRTEVAESDLVGEAVLLQPRQILHLLLGCELRIELVEQVDVDVVSAQALEGLLDETPQTLVGAVVHERQQVG